MTTTQQWELRHYYVQIGDTRRVGMCTTDTAGEGTTGTLTHAVMLDDREIPEGTALDIADAMQKAVFAVSDKR